MRKALNVADTFPSDVRWGDMPWTYPFNNDEGWDADGYPDARLGEVAKELDLSDMYIELSKRLKVLVFAGDIDNQVPAIGLERWVVSLGLAVREPWRAWVEPTSGEIAGSVLALGDGDDPSVGLLFATVRGAGHSVLGDRPAAGSAMFEWFLRGERFDGPLAPPPLPAKL